MEGPSRPPFFHHSIVPARLDGVIPSQQQPRRRPAFAEGYSVASAAALQGPSQPRQGRLIVAPGEAEGAARGNEQTATRAPAGRLKMMPARRDWPQRARRTQIVQAPSLPHRFQASKTSSPPRLVSAPLFPPFIPQTPLSPQHTGCHRL